MIHLWPFFKLTNLWFFKVKSEAKWEKNKSKLLKEIPLKVAEYENADDIPLLH